MDKIFFVTSNKNHFKEEVDLTEVNNYLSKNKDYYVASVTPLYQSIAKQAEADMQKILDAIQSSELERAKKADAARIETEKQLAAIEKAKQDAYAATVASIMESISPDLIAAMTSKSNAAMLETVTASMAPVAIAKGESVADVTNKLLRGTSLEGVLENIGAMKIPE